MAPASDSSKVPRNHTVAKVIEFLDNPKNTLLPKIAQEFFEDKEPQCKDKEPQCKDKFQLKSNLMDPAKKQSNSKLFPPFIKWCGH